MSVTPNWRRCAQITIPTASVPGDQTDFPVKLAWNGTNGNVLAEVYNVGVTSPKSTGADIRFTSDSAGITELPFQIVTFSSNATVANARVLIWVKLSSVSSATPTSFYMWWNNPDAVAYAATDTYGRNNVWTNGFAGVFHLDESSGTTATNSVGSNDGTYTGTTFPNSVDTTYGYMQNFVNANGDYVALTGTSPWQITANLTMSAIVSVTSWTAAWQAIIAKGDSTYRLSRNNVNNYGSFDKNAGVDSVNSTTIDTGLHHVVATFDSSVGMYDYVDGSAGTSFNSDTTAIVSNTDVLCIGRNVAYTTRDWNGYIGEVKISNVTRSSTWVTTEYNTTINFASFATSTIVTLSASIAAELVGWWMFEEGSGTTAVDSSYKLNHGTASGAPAYTVGRLGPYALNLVGASSQYVTLPSGFATLLTTTTNFTFAGWVYNNSSGTWTRIFDFGTGTTVYMFLTVNSNTGVPRFAITTSSSGGEQGVSGTASFPAGWNHIAVTLLGATATLYINGSSVATNTGMSLTPASLGTTTQNYFGKSQWADPYLNAYIDDFRFYNRALTTVDITLLYNYPGMADISSNIAMWWKFDEAVSGVIGANAVIDASGNANAGTGYTSPTWGTGKIDKGCLSLVSASGQYVSCSSLVNGPNTQAAQTFSAWVYCTSIGSQMDIVSDSNYSSGNQLRLTTTGYLEVSKWGGGVVCTATTLPLSTTTWYHVAWAYDGSGNSMLYVNGVSCTLTGVTTPQSGIPTVMTAGSYGGPGIAGEYFDGKIDDARIYNRCLNFNDILQLYSYRGNTAGFFAVSR